MCQHPTPLIRQSLLALAILACLPAMAQTPPPTTEPAAEAPAPAFSERIERITHEDDHSRIDELRVGGQTRHIAVQPKNGAPAYEIVPAQGAADLGEGANKTTGASGRSRWRILNF
ncbi:DUF2782 domain-containing protein [Hydrogenophaga taeniospiralis]|uniref:DUF2782 domain-containing protein n=1 Tax=Hydrogenophaga taeniospiralis TaxID=65656 RepID=UPI001CFB9990|nr:DUF2782 domain-containing protein [Hydrogenophaga taeniospiralis]MCB4364872.1 DUF2782 domain-containing protein [Hydrogenophaga taeniospiralis]